jgi:5-deoxy-glucuronate isomerase
VPAHFPLEKMVFRETDSKSGRNIIVTPNNSATQHLAYGRIILDPSLPSVRFATGNRETGLICLLGWATVSVDGQSFPLGLFDAIYIPRDSQVEVSTTASTDLVEFSADVEDRYPVQCVYYAETAKDPTLTLDSGIPGQSLRHRHIVFGKNVTAGRLAVGLTYAEPGNWSSWPPHEHTATLEEIYVYFDMPSPAFGLQLVYDNTDYPEMIVPVREGDAVLMPSGYHPNVCVPGHRIRYIWGMAAHREKIDRKLGMGKVQPDFT